MISRRLLITLLVLLSASLVLGAYLWRLRWVARNTPVADTRPVEPPASGPTTPVTLWIADDQAGVLRPTPKSIPLSTDPQTRAEDLLRAVVGSYLESSSAHPLPAGSEVRSVFLVAPGLAVVDLNGAFANQHRSGILVEELTVASLVQTLAANQSGIKRVRFLVEGRPRETLAGHLDLSSDFDVGQVSQLAQALQAAQ